MFLCWLLAISITGIPVLVESYFPGLYKISEVCVGLPLVKNVVAVKLQTNARRLKIDSYALPSFQLGNTLSSNPASIVNIVIRVNQPIDDIVHTYLQ